MQKLELLIEENAFGAVRPVEVVADVPIGVLVPALVEELKLPQTDLFGKKLVYTLRCASERNALPEATTLVASGIAPGTRLALDSHIVDGSATPGQAFSPPLHAGYPSQWSNMPSSQPLDPALNASETIADYNVLPILGRGETPITGYFPLKKRRWTRRALLLTTVTVLGVGGTGLGYAAYQHFISGVSPSMNQAQHMQPAAPAATAIPKPMLPTKATPVFSFTRHMQTVRSVAWSHDGMQLASGADDNQAFIWGVGGNVLQQFGHPGSVRALAWSPEGQRVVTGSGTQVAFYNVQSGQQLARSTRRHVGVVNSLAWTPQNMQQVVSGGADMRAIVWETKTYHAQVTFMKHNSPIEAVAWAVDGQTVASSSQGGAVRIWNGESGNELHGYYQDVQMQMRALAFAPGGTQLSVGGDDGMVRFWNAGTCGQQVQTNGALRCTDMPQRLQVSNKAIRTLAWSPDGRFLATGSDDGMLALWYPMQSQKPLFTMQLNAAVHSVAWNPNGGQLAVATGNVVTLYKIA